MQSVRILIVLFAILPIVAANAASTELPEPETLRGWVEEMKSAPRGPFTRLRWFCNDGTVLPPKAYACREHGGGVQHGEWTNRVKLMRANGYFIANVFADIEPSRFIENPDHVDMVKQMILEQFLIDADNGWILRKARYYRGALQTEDEIRGGESLLLAIGQDPEWIRKRYVVLREAVRFVPRGRDDAPISEMRQVALSIAEKDKEFEMLRIKLHVRPELTDAAEVRNYANSHGKAELTDDYEHLARTIEEVYQPRDVGPAVSALLKQISSPKLRRQISRDARGLQPQTGNEDRFTAVSRMLKTLRDSLPNVQQASSKLALLDTSLELEGDLYRSGNDIIDALPGSTRRQRLRRLGSCYDGLYGMGLISARQHKALQENIANLLKTDIQLNDYQDGLDYAARVPEWADRHMRFHFADPVDRLSDIEPLTRRYIHDRLRGSLLLLYSAVLDSLIADAAVELGIQNVLFDQRLASGLRGLNAGLARGVLMVSSGEGGTPAFERNGIYVLPATTEDLPPVAGIITAGKGNILSHVQLLARNLGIPNVAVDQPLVPRITVRAGAPVVLAVSPRGIVQLVEDGNEWDDVFDKQAQVQDVVIRPDLSKLDLYNLNFISLDQMRSIDSGQIAGPKAANLGELKHHFPEAVTEGLVIPFGHFRKLLDQPMEPGGSSVFSWLQQQYAFIESLDGEPLKQERVARRFLDRIRNWIMNADPGQDFRNRLEASMAEIFGPDGSYGVFVRSDTNVEDLPGFTGAGLNLTVVNVVGVENVLEAIKRVWASPFTERAYRWRQAYMEDPEHIYASVLLLKSVPVEKSGVMITADIDSGQPGWLTIAVNEGVGGAVSGQTSEELRVDLATGDVRLMAQASEPHRRVIRKDGGIAKIPASGDDYVLSPKNLEDLTAFAGTVADRFPMLRDVRGEPVPADIEFGFYRDRLVLFQIRPFLESSKARQSLFLNGLDQRLQERFGVKIDLDAIPASQ